MCASRQGKGVGLVSLYFPERVNLMPSEVAILMGFVSLNPNVDRLGVIGCCDMINIQSLVLKAGEAQLIQFFINGVVCLNHSPCTGDYNMSRKGFGILIQR